MDRDARAFAASFFFHLAVLLALGLAPQFVPDSGREFLIVAPLLDDQGALQQLDDEYFFSDNSSQEIGANSNGDVSAALSLAPVVSETSDVPVPTELTPTDDSQIQFNEAIQVATGLHFDKTLAVKGAAGEGTTGAMGAIDRLTQEILTSLDERKTLVVWLFDQSGSLGTQRSAIRERLERVYDELGVMDATGNPAFARHDDKPLLSSVISFGEQVNLLTKKPTDNVAEIKEKVAAIEQDNSGIERVFTAVAMAANLYREYRVPQGPKKEPERNVLIVVFSDEAGDDQEGVDKTVQMCRRYGMPVYVVGVPAPFGLRETLVKWVDPDPSFDQSPQWGEVVQGPESLVPERVKLRFSDDSQEDEAIDSGFGPFALTRLSYETGGIYFAVHPNRNVSRAVSESETAAYSAHLRFFFDPEIMRKYRPDYVTAAEYLRRVNANKTRAALVEASRRSWLSPMERPRLRFVKRDEAGFVAELSEAQKVAAKLEPKVVDLYNVLNIGEADRDQEASPRWQAGYDLAMGRVMALRVRTESFNVLLAQAKRGMKFSDPNNNTWNLSPSDEIVGNTQLEKAAEKARMYLKRVIQEHDGTPWALLAKRELNQPMAWKWAEEFTDLNPPATAVAANNAPAAAPANDTPQVIQAPPPKRPPPKL